MSGSKDERARRARASRAQSGVEPSSLLGQLLSLPTGFVREHAPGIYPKHRARESPAPAPERRRPR